MLLQASEQSRVVLSPKIVHLRLVHNTTRVALRCLRVDVWIDLDPILVCLCVAFLRLIVEKSLDTFVINFCVL